MKRSTYSEKLKDPRWQKKRLEVMGYDSFKCVECGSESKTLNVHHTYYVSGRNPWDYPSRSLLTLCQDCHKDDPEAWRYGIAGWEDFAALENDGLRMYGIQTDFVNALDLFCQRNNEQPFEVLHGIADGLRSGALTKTMFQSFLIPPEWNADGAGGNTTAPAITSNM